MMFLYLFSYVLAQCGKNNKTPAPLYAGQRHKYLTLILMAMLFVQSMGGIASASASTITGKSYAFDTVNVLDDLLSAQVGGKAFNLDDYPADPNGAVGIISVVEWCYSYDPRLMDSYALYLYVYNPRGLYINTTSAQNVVQMACAYDDNGMPKDYDKFDLYFCNKSGGNYLGLFYKFRVIDHKGTDGKTVAERVRDAERRYDISGIELIATGEANATEYTVGGTFVFSGYAKGFGSDLEADSTLSCEVKDLETVHLYDLDHTYYRTGVSSLGAGHQNELNSVWFSVPNRFIDSYGNLERVKAEWWEYKTAPIFVLNNAGLMTELSKLVGREIGEYNRDIIYTIYDNYQEMWNPLSGHYEKYNYCYNKYSSNNVVETSITQLAYLFDAKGTNVKNYTLPSKTLKEYVYGYDASFIKDKINVKGREFSGDLFVGNVDSGRTKGYNLFDIRSDAQIDLLSYDDNPSHNWLTKIIEFGLAWWAHPDTNDSYKNVPPIQQVDGEVKGTASQVANEYLIAQDDAERFKSFCKQAEADDRTPFIVRYAQTDYFSTQMYVYDRKAQKEYKDVMYMSQQTVFFDFDVISLTFFKEGVETVIPAVASPMDIVNSITPPVFWDFDWDSFWASVWEQVTAFINDAISYIPSWMWIAAGAVVLAILCVLLKPVWLVVKAVFIIVGLMIKYVFIGIWTIVTAPVRLVSSLFGKGQDDG